MSEYLLDFDFLRTQHYLKDQLGNKELPNLNAILFLIGLQELGRWKKTFTKEEKQDLMHVAVCRLLSIRGYYEFTGRDQDGWPHWNQLKALPAEGVEAQEKLLKELVVRYFDQHQKEQKKQSFPQSKNIHHEEE